VFPAKSRKRDCLGLDVGAAGRIVQKSTAARIAAPARHTHARALAPKISQQPKRVSSPRSPRRIASRERHFSLVRAVCVRLAFSCCIVHTMARGTATCAAQEGRGGVRAGSGKKATICASHRLAVRLDGPALAGLRAFMRRRGLSTSAAVRELLAAGGGAGKVASSGRRA